MQYANIKRIHRNGSQELFTLFASLPYILNYLNMKIKKNNLKAINRPKNLLECWSSQQQGYHSYNRCIYFKLRKIYIE